MGVKVKVEVQGLRELERALEQLSKATARNVLKRVLMKAGAPIADAARQKVPIDRGQLKLSIKVSSKVKNTAGKAEYAATLRATGDRAAAQGALRTARRSAKGQASFAVVHVGPGALPQAHLVEFGTGERRGVGGKPTGRMTPQPYLRPAWDANKTRALDIIKAELWGEIERAAKRAARKGARKR